MVIPGVCPNNHAAGFILIVHADSDYVGVAEKAPVHPGREPTGSAWQGGLAVGSWEAEGVESVHAEVSTS